MKNKKTEKRKLQDLYKAGNYYGVISINDFY